MSQHQRCVPKLSGFDNIVGGFLWSDDKEHHHEDQEGNCIEKERPSKAKADNNRCTEHRSNGTGRVETDGI